jgi:sterol desaturase/sphingolipid hydroxylase (fatty acid hydroxylase superfamily)
MATSRNCCFRYSTLDSDYLFDPVRAERPQLEHANIKLNSRLDRWLRLVIVTPHMHKAHHSRDQRETDSNYSNIFSLWDRLCGTYTGEVNFRRLRYGLDGFDVEERQTLSGLLKMPFMSYKECVRSDL